MSNLSSHLFQVVNDQPVYCPVLLNIPCYKELYLRDTTDDKSEYSKQLAFIWYYKDMGSPFFNSENMKEECMLAAFGTKSYSISPLLQTCIDEYEKRQSTPELRSLRSAMELLDQLVAEMRHQANSEEYYNLIKDLEKEASMESDFTQRWTLLELADKRKEALNKQKESVVKMIPSFQKSIESLIELRKSATKSLSEIDHESNKDNIANHIIYDIIDKNRGYV